MIFKNQSFLNEELHMDFNTFVSCTFTNCTLVYHGFGIIGMEGCTFTNVRWVFADAAANTVSFMTGLYTGGGDGGRLLVERTFENIKAGFLPKLERAT